MAQSNNYNTPTNFADIVIETDPTNFFPPTPFDTNLGNKWFISQL
ncbi:hypothetical protein [cyanobacterium endosymbiont of Epithemia turgida]|nr:hypothetical protein [cyanobacterium endosymbiont of Epithemia turgida]BAP18480.1 hypothetical protein ETSB_1776 [cyanobacterium endosymbiont of Epithemia turgida isolate EtSB Lake Yunoko]